MNIHPMSPANDAAIERMTGALKKLLAPFIRENKILAIKVEFMAAVGDAACVGGYVGRSDAAPGALQEMKALIEMGTEMVDRERSN